MSSWRYELTRPTTESSTTRLEAWNQMTATRTTLAVDHHGNWHHTQTPWRPGPTSSHEFQHWPSIFRHFTISIIVAQVAGRLLSTLRKLVLLLVAELHLWFAVFVLLCHEILDLIVDTFFLGREKGYKTVLLITWLCATLCLCFVIWLFMQHRNNGYLLAKWEERARIEPLAATPSQLGCLGVSRSDHLNCRLKRISFFLSIFLCQCELWWWSRSSSWSPFFTSQVVWVTI